MQGFVFLETQNNEVIGTNSTDTNAYWNYIASFLSDPTPEDIACQAPKPILLNTGAIDFPAPWVIFL